MSDDTEPTPDPSPTPAKEAAPRSRRIAPVRPKKNAKPKPEASESAAQVEPASAAPVEVEVAPESRSNSNGNDWPEPEAATAGQPILTESAKRKRRRRKGKGKGEGSQNAAPHHAGSFSAPEPEGAEENGNSEEISTVVPPAPSVSTPKSHPQSPRPKIDPDLLTKMAWKIYLAEVSEEGVALIGDNDAKDLSRRCFRLAEIFVEEQIRRR